ncbi:hypothetical protein GCM10025867_37310 [Frondihabitans sucicola]|uniref:Alpha-D-phosphohexomutase alpha/beta/alpha domain-containing protein n=1 Tax=Frondihabitans sucicola TaxID=1268041 RepID=A0ABN6Y2D2_9MICO|nr:hypothetical protein GCM10025867_37310 [Frondihabitans sucicola]
MTSDSPVDLTAFVKTYDVRGLVGSQLTPEVVEAFGAAFADEIGSSAPEIVVGHDMRDSSPEFAAAFSRGVTARGTNVTLLGLCSTDETYFASGSRNAPAAMFTASHNPATYNGIKFSRAGAQGISLDTGLSSIRDRASAFLTDGVTAVDESGEVTPFDALPSYAAYLRSLVDLSAIRPITIVVDAGNGMGGLTVPAVLGTAAGLPELPIEIIPSTSSSTARSPTTRRTRSSPRTSSICRRPSSSTAPTSGSPSTATPTAASWSTRRATPSRRPPSRPSSRFARSRASEPPRPRSTST